MPSAQPRLISISTSTIVRALAILMALGIAWLIRDILLTVFTALLLAGVVYPFVRWAKARHIPRGAAVLAFYVFLFGAIILALSLLIPAILDELHSFVSLYGQSTPWFSGSADYLRRLIEPNGIQRLSAALQSQSDLVGGLFGALSSVFGSVVSFFAVIVLSFYMILEESAVKNLFRNLIPAEYQDFVTRLIWQVVDKLGAWMRGQLILGLIIGVLYFIGFITIGLPYALLLAIIGGLLEFVPYIGPFIAAVPAVIFGLSISPLYALLTLGVVVIIQQLENNVIVPKVMQRAVGLNPIVSLVAFMVGAKLFGAVGAIFAIPVATAASVVLVEVMRFRREA